MAAVVEAKVQAKVQANTTHTNASRAKEPIAIYSHPLFSCSLAQAATSMFSSVVLTIGCFTNEQAKPLSDENAMRAIRRDIT